MAATAPKQTRMATFKKDITDYFPSDELPRTEEPVNQPPATTFLREVVEICDAVRHCQRSFARKKNGDFTKDSADSFRLIVTSAFALLMSNFETYQKSQFAILLDARFMFRFDDDLAIANKLEKVGCNITLSRVLAGGGEFGDTGQIIADAMPGWHNAEKVNDYFKVLFPTRNFYSKDLISEFRILWQLRHSIVHTGGQITAEDAMKIRRLKYHRDRVLEFGEDFMPAVGRRFHIMIQVLLDPLRPIVEELFETLDESPEEKEEIIHSIVGYESSRRSWFRSS